MTESREMAGEQLMGTFTKKKKGRCSTKNDAHTNSCIEDVEDTKEWVRWIQQCLESLPAVNMNTLRYLIRHMQVIIATDSLKMSRETFADAFSTTLDIPTIVIVEMVTYFSDIFEHEQSESANDSSSDESTSDSGGGSKKYREMGNGNSMEE